MATFLHLPGWQVAGVDERPTEYLVKAKYQPEPEGCPKCGVVGELYRHGVKPTEFRDGPVRGKHVTILAERSRWRCRACGQTFLQPLPDMVDGRRMTVRCLNYVRENALVRPFTQIASEIGIDEKTVRLITSEHMEALEAGFRPYAPRVLGLDELKLDGALRVMVTDIDRAQPIDLLDAYNKRRIVHWLAHVPERSRIQAVVMDMSETFRQSVEMALPGVPIIADKWHVIRAATGALNSIRIAKGRKAATKTAKRAAFRGRYLLLKSPAKLTAEQAFKLDGMLLNDPDLRAAYEAKEAFLAIWNAPAKPEAMAAIDAWLAGIPEQHREAFRHAERALREWRRQILAYWDHRVTNAFTESANGMAKIANRTGRGYGFNVIRARVLYGLERIDPNEFVRCESCGVSFAAGMLVGQTPVTVGRGHRRKPLTLCPNCHAFHTRPDGREVNHSTDQSE